MIGILDPEGKNKNPLNDEEYSIEYKQLSEYWKKLPAYEKRNEIIQCIRNNQVTLITSGTGSGKTVLVPKLCLHAIGYDKKLMVTLPKQIIAKNAAEFSAKTLDVKVGEHIGYKYRGSNKKKAGKKPNILYTTDGTAVSKLLEDSVLSEYDSVIIDEAHERKIQIDLLLFLLKGVIDKRPHFKVIIMSATINPKIFSKYYKDYSFQHIDVGGKTNFEIQSIFLDHQLDRNSNSKYLDEAYKIISQIYSNSGDNNGSIIFFVPSIIETVEVCKMSVEKFPDIFCVSVYSGVSKETEEIAQHLTLFKEMYPDKKRKLIVATNVAESSLTIEGIKYVIDSGYEVKSLYDPELNSDIIERGFITKAQVKQRMGRTGRTEPGICYHVYTKKEHDDMKDFPDASILTSNLYNEIFKLMFIYPSLDSLKQILQKFIEPPKKEYINSAVDILKKLKLIDTNNHLSKLGKVLRRSPVSPVESIVLFSSQHLNCFREVCVILSVINHTKGNVSDLFTGEDSDKKRKKAKKYSVKNSDHLTMLRIYKSYDPEKSEFNHSIFKKIKKMSKLMYRSRFVSNERQTKKNTSNNSSLEKRILCCFQKGLVANVGMVKEKGKVFLNEKNIFAKIDKNSVFNDSENIGKRFFYSTVTKFDKDIFINVVSIFD